MHLLRWYIALLLITRTFSNEFSCNGYLPYGRLSHSEMGSSGFKKVNP